MQTLRSVRHRHTNPLSSTTTTASFFTTTISSSAATSPILHQNSPPYTFLHPPSTIQLPSKNSSSNLTTNDIVSSFKAWFLSRRNPFLDEIFHILDTQDGFALESSLASLNLLVDENLVLKVLNYQKKPDVLSCLKFFDWAGRQKGFFHTRATFTTIFRILYKAKFMSLMLEFLETFHKQRHPQKVRFYTTLVIGYSVAGKPEIALQMFGRMRFQGIDLDSFGYNVLLNSLVEKGPDEAFEMVVKQMRLRGLENMITHSIVTKNFCKKREFDKAEEYLRSLPGEGLSGVAIAEFIDVLCEDKQFKRAATFVEDLRKSNNFSMEPVYRAWIRYLIKAGKLGGALEFLKDKNIVDGYIPDIFCYNSLIYKLVRDNRLQDVFDLLTEMKQQHILPDELTMNSTLCFFCKSGMVDVALELYDSREEFGMSVSTLSYNYLINTLVGDVSVDEAYRVLETATAVNQGFSLGEKTISVIADALCREGKHEKLKNLFVLALEKKCKLKDSTYSKFISSLCNARRAEDGYLFHLHLNQLNKVSSRRTYLNLIKGFNEASRGDIAANLLIEMQEKGHIPNRWLFRTVISSLCLKENSEEQVLRLLQMQLTRMKPRTLLFNHFIDAAGHAKKPEISRKVYEIMSSIGIRPNFKSHVLMLKSYLNSDKIADALIFFQGLPDERRTSKKMWNGMICGLCRIGRLDQALELFWQMRANEIRPNMLCIDSLVQLVCKNKKYSVVFSIIDDMTLVGHRMSSFIGNVLLLNCLYSRKVFDAWIRSRNAENQTPSHLMLGKLIGAFSGCIDVSQDVEDMEELIKQCFTPDLFTYNMLLRKLIMTQIDQACDYINKIQEKGYEPNQWTYDALVHGYYKYGRDSEARKWRDVMLQKRFGLSECTKLLA